MQPEPLNLIWGTNAIAEAIGRTRRQTEEALYKGHIPGAKKVNGRWVISMKCLRDYFEGASA